MKIENRLKSNTPFEIWPQCFEKLLHALLSQYETNWIFVKRLWELAIIEIFTTMWLTFKATKLNSKLNVMNSYTKYEVLLFCSRLYFHQFTELQEKEWDHKMKSVLSIYHFKHSRSESFTKINLSSMCLFFFIM